MNDARGRTVKRLDIHVRESLGRGSASGGHLTVWCPWQSHDVPLEHCVACSGCTLIKLPCSDNEGFILCDGEEQHPREPQSSAAAPAFGSAERVRVTAIMTGRFDVRTSPARCIPANTSIARAAAVMASENVESLPVVGALGEVVGVVTVKDVLGWFARSHGYVLDTD